MATNKNITMKQFNGTDYDTLYPKTKVEQVEGAYTQQQILADSTKGLYGLGNDAVPDDVLSYLHNAVRKEIIMQYESDGTVFEVYIDLTSVDFRKRIFVELDAGENESAGIIVQFDQPYNVTTADIITMVSSNSSASSLNYWIRADKGFPKRFELTAQGTGGNEVPNYLQFDIRAGNDSSIFIVSGGTPIKRLRLHSDASGFKAGSKITVYAIS